MPDRAAEDRRWRHHVEGVEQAEAAQKPFRENRIGLGSPKELVEERADRLAMFATLLDDPDMINRQLERYLSVTPEEIQAVAAEVFRPDNRVVITYVPAAEAAAGQDEETAA